MTYPQHIDPRYAQQYAPPQQYPTYPQAPATAGPQYPPQQPAPAIGGAALPTTPPPLATGGSAGGGSWPKMRHLQGCTIIFEPIRVDETKTTTVKQGGQTVVVPQPEAYFNLIVVDSPTGKIQYGDSLDSDKPAPLAWERETPCRFTNVNDYGYGPVNEVRNALAAGEPARVGVVERGTQGNKPYLITKPDKMVGGADRPDGQARFERASQVWAGVFGSLHGGAPFTNPEPRSLLQAPQQAPQQVAYQPAPAQPFAPSYPQQYADPANAYGQVPPPPAYGQQPPAPQQFQGYGAYDPQTGGIAPQGYPAQPVYAPPAPPQPAAPANPFEQWIATLPADQQAGARAQYAAQQSAPPAPGAPPGI